MIVGVPGCKHVAAPDTLKVSGQTAGTAAADEQVLTEVEVQTRDTVISIARTHARKTLRNGISLLYLLTLDVDLGAVHERRMVLCRACAKRLVAACGKLFDIGRLAAAAVQRLNGNIYGARIRALPRDKSRP